MPILQIKDFSCIKSATVQTSRLTILIGPQASGKSIITKLMYFFYDTISYPTRQMDGTRQISAFSSDTAEQFCKWFPPSAWGDGKFILSFVSGPLEIRIERRNSRKLPADRVSIHFSDNFRQLFDRTLLKFSEIKKINKETYSPDSFQYYDLEWKIRREARLELDGLIKDDSIDHQMFVPAGRSFFTSVGKAIAVFDQGGFLDPATLQFGRYWASVRDRRFAPHYGYGRNGEANQSLMANIFGGFLRTERDAEYVEAKDGRRIPLSALSSGQQELLPLWLALQTTFSDPDRRGLMYIEEPEAHLFPSAQAQLIQHLAGMVCAPRDKRRMIITTHSPYILSKINNLIKAGSLGYRSLKSKQDLIANIIPREFWLLKGQVSCYAIVSGGLVSIVGHDGLIDGNYLDGISSDIMSEFDELLEVQFRGSSAKRGSLK